MSAGYLAAMKAEILDCVEAGLVPHTVSSFAELHDHIDANCLGGLCEEEMFSGLVEQFGGRDEHASVPQAMLDFINLNHNAVDLWIKSGALMETAK